MDKFLKYFAVGLAAVIVVWCFYAINYEQPRPAPQLVSDANVQQHLESLVFKALPKLSKQQQQLADFGKKLFFDPRFSADGKISCAFCHQPERSFTDGKSVATALGVSTRNTPTLINMFASNWFFWDGRADSLASQSLGPVENLKEHGFNRVAIARVLRERYQHQYEKFFGPWPQALTSEVLKQDALPQAPALAMPAATAAYSVASLKDFLLQTRFMSGGASPAAKFSEFSMSRTPYPQEWTSAWGLLTTSNQGCIDQVAANFGLALAMYEETLLAVDSPFDRFAKRVLAGVKLKDAIGAGFDEDALAGLKIFLGKGECILCHYGPAFTDNQFHNTGLPQFNNNPIDVGRARGVIEAVNDRFNCRGGILPKTERESCLELGFLDDSNTELVGAFKTPTLRNLSDTAPYLHDGRFNTLDEVIDFYNELPGEAIIGHREESLRPLQLSSEEQQQLKKFLQSLQDQNPMQVPSRE